MEMNGENNNMKRNRGKRALANDSNMMLVAT